MDLTKIKSNPSNPRVIKDEKFKKLCASIKEFPKMLELRPIIVDSEGIILGGNMRFKAIQSLGMPLQEAWFKEANTLTDVEKRRFIVEDNVGLGEWDWDSLANQYEKVELEDWGLDVDKIFGKHETKEDEAPPLSDGEPVSKLGEVYQLGRHKLMCGDSTKMEQVEILMGGVQSDMVFTDPPYLMGFEGNVHADGSKSFNAKHGKIENDKMSRGDGDKFILSIFEAISKFNKGAYYVCFYRLGLDYIFRALDTLKTKYRALIIWDKGNHTLSGSDYMSRYEPIVYGWFKDHKFYGDRSNFDIWHIDRTAKNDLHPTMKPIELCATAIRNSSVEGDIILDLFGGSGSTLIACEQLNRICYMMEFDPKYCDVIRKRYAKFINKEEKWQETTPKI